MPVKMNKKDALLRQKKSPVAAVRNPWDEWGTGGLPPKASPKKAIRLHCLECNGERQVRIENDCPNVQCFLHQHRPWAKFTRPKGKGRSKVFAKESDKDHKDSTSPVDG